MCSVFNIVSAGARPKENWHPLCDGFLDSEMAHPTLRAAGDEGATKHNASRILAPSPKPQTTPRTRATRPAPAQPNPTKHPAPSTCTSQPGKAIDLQPLTSLSPSVLTYSTLQCRALRPPQLRTHNPNELTWARLSNAKLRGLPSSESSEKLLVGGASPRSALSNPRPKQSLPVLEPSRQRPSLDTYNRCTQPCENLTRGQSFAATRAACACTTLWAPHVLLDAAPEPESEPRQSRAYCSLAPDSVLAATPAPRPRRPLYAPLRALLSSRGIATPLPSCTSVNACPFEMLARLAAASCPGVALARLAALQQHVALVEADILALVRSSTRLLSSFLPCLWPALGQSQIQKLDQHVAVCVRNNKNHLPGWVAYSGKLACGRSVSLPAL